MDVLNITINMIRITEHMGKHIQLFAGDFLNLDKRDPNEGTLSCSSSEESTATRGFLVRPGKYIFCQVHPREGTMRHEPREGEGLL